MIAHPTDCCCVDCFRQLQHYSDGAHTQVLKLHDELASIRKRVQSLRSSVLLVIEECDSIDRQIARHIGAET